MVFEDEFTLLLKSKSVLIYLVSLEEERIEYIIRRLMQSYFQRLVYTWDFVNGFSENSSLQSTRRNPFEALSKIQTNFSNIPSLFLLKDFSSFFSDLAVLRELKNLSIKLRNQPQTILLLSKQNLLPDDLKEDFRIIELPLPDLNSLKKEFIRLFESIEYQPDIEFFNSAVNSSRGLPLQKIRSVFIKALIKQYDFENFLIDLILEEKKFLISKNQVLEFWEPKESLSQIGGLNNLKSWLNKRKIHFSESSSNYGFLFPKGILLVGVPGTGKSLIAKSISSDWNLPLLRLDMGKLFGTLVGESEMRMRQMIQIAESLSPCILWIDELEKSANFSSSSSDGGTNNRIFSTFLTWLAEKQDFVFVVATANNIDKLPLELLRRGRFDEIFFLDLPTFTERVDIFALQLKEFRPETWKTYDLQLLADQTPMFSGAEIRQLIIESMYYAYSERRDFTTQDILNILSSFIPLAILDPKSIKYLQSWAKSGRIRSASNDYINLIE